MLTRFWRSSLFGFLWLLEDFSNKIRRSWEIFVFDCDCSVPVDPLWPQIFHHVNSYWLAMQASELCVNNILRKLIYQSWILRRWRLLDHQFLFHFFNLTFAWNNSWANKKWVIVHKLWIITLESEKNSEFRIDNYLWNFIRVVKLILQNLGFTEHI